jgi:hypothetical protein
MKKVKIPTITVPQQAQKAAKSKNRVASKGKGKKIKLARIIGHPPMDSVPPDIQDTRPKIKLKPRSQERMGDLDALDHAAPQVARPQAPVTPAKRNVVMTGRIVQGQSCTWLGDLGEAGDDSENPEIPVCPHCGGKLVHAGDQEVVRMGNRLYELGAYEVMPSDRDQTPARPHPNFVDFVAWMKDQPKCWPSAEDAALDYTQATGKICDPSR